AAAEFAEPQVFSVGEQDGRRTVGGLEREGGLPGAVPSPDRAARGHGEPQRAGRGDGHAVGIAVDLDDLGDRGPAAGSRIGSGSWKRTVGKRTMGKRTVLRQTRPPPCESRGSGGAARDRGSP